MRKISVITVIICSLLLVTNFLYPYDYKNIGLTNPRAVSLKMLQQKLQQANGSIPDDLNKFCGVNRIVGYIVDKKNRDVILVGNVDKTLPPLYLDDFVVALRNVWGKYDQLKGNTLYHHDPGCSIDPSPRYLAKLKKITKQFQEAKDAAKIEKAIEKWKDVCSEHQLVTVFGIPFHTRFAKIMVEADYHMKQLVNGGDSLNNLWFSSMSELQADQIKELIRSRKSVFIPAADLNRFWFAPGENSYLESDGIVAIRFCPVTLMTEKEQFTQKGKRGGTGRAAPNALKFAREFTASFFEIADKRPIYRQLENLYRFVALAKIIKCRAPHRQAGLNLDYLLVKYPLRPVTVRKKVPGRFNVTRVKYPLKNNGEEGERIFKIWVPNCGGVTIDMKTKPRQFKKDKSNALDDLKQKTIDERTQLNTAAWNLSKNLLTSIEAKTVSNKKAGDEYHAIVLLDSHGALSNGHIAIMLGNEKDGYMYYSKNGKNKKNSKDHYNTFGEFKYFQPKYDKAFQIDISKTQWKKMKRKAEKDINTPYKLVLNDCADFTRKVLKEGNLEYGKHSRLQPKSYFSYVKSNNKGKALKR